MDEIFYPLFYLEIDLYIQSSGDDCDIAASQFIKFMLALRSRGDNAIFMQISVWSIMGISGNCFFAASHSLMFEGLFFPDCIYCPWHWRLGNVFAHAEHHIQTSMNEKLPIFP
jgi:hypothetical protein